jgi:hypothetical protein
MHKRQVKGMGPKIWLREKRRRFEEARAKGENKKHRKGERRQAGFASRKV